MNRQNSPIPSSSLSGECCTIPILSTIAHLTRYWNRVVLTLWSLVISGSMIEMHPYLMQSEHFDLVLVWPGIFFSFIEVVGLLQSFYEGLFISLCVRCIEFTSFYNINIWCLNSSDAVLFYIFHFISCGRPV